MPEVRLIDANAAADKIMHDVEVHADEIGIGAVAIMIAFARALRDETDFPTIEPEVRHAEWDCIDDDGGVYRCSACGEAWYLEAGTPKENNMNYCPTCGAKMDGGADNG